MESRCVIYLEKYAKQVNIEAGIMVEMAKRYIFPAATASAEDFARAASALAAVGALSSPQELRARKLAELAAAVADEADKLEKALDRRTGYRGAPRRGPRLSRERRPAG